MNLSIHIGLKKTGTTSLQQVLLASLGGRPKSGVWYPAPSDGRPGHAAMARALMRRDTSEFDKAIHFARRNGVSNLVLSSEDFEIAYGCDRMDHLRRCLSGFSVHLLVTINSPIRRFASLWQESVKHGHPLPPLEESFDEIVKRPGFQVDFVEHFAERLSPKRLSVIIVHSERPRDLFQNVFAALRAKLDVFHTPEKSNQRLGITESEIIRTVAHQAGRHGLDHHQTVKARGELMKLFRSEAWKSSGISFPVETPELFKSDLRALARQTGEGLDRMANRGVISVYGNINDLALE